MKSERKAQFPYGWACNFNRYGFAQGFPYGLLIECKLPAPHLFWRCNYEESGNSAVFPEFLWLATGSLSQFNDRLNVLLGRKVIALPDLVGYELWRKKAREYLLLDITVSYYLEKIASQELREMGADLANWVVEEMGGIT